MPGSTSRFLGAEKMCLTTVTWYGGGIAIIGRQGVTDLLSPQYLQTCIKSVLSSRPRASYRRVQPPPKCFCTNREMHRDGGRGRGSFDRERSRHGSRPGAAAADSVPRGCSLDGARNAIEGRPIGYPSPAAAPAGPTLGYRLHDLPDTNRTIAWRRPIPTSSADLPTG